MAAPLRPRGIGQQDLERILDEPVDYSSDSELESDCSESEALSSASEDNSDQEIDDRRQFATWDWKEAESTYRGRKIDFRPNSEPGPQIHVQDVLESFRAFFDDELIELIVEQTNKYATQYLQNARCTPKFRVRKWLPTDKSEILVLLAMYMLMGIVQKPNVRSYFSTNSYIETPIFSQIMSVDRYELLCKFLHFENNENKENFQGPEKLFKIHAVLQKLNGAFSASYGLGQNIAIDESLALWRGRLSFRQYIPLKAAKFGVKTYELCDSETGYLWSFLVYTGAGTTFHSTYSELLDSKTSKIVLKLVEPLLGSGRVLWMDNFYNSPDLASFLKEHGINIAGTLRINRKNVPKEIKKKKLKKGEQISYHSKGILITKWMDKKNVTMISTFHDTTMKSVVVRGKEVTKPQCVVEYNHSMGGVDLKDQKVQPYLIERKRGKKWYIKLFKRLLNVTVHNAYVLYCKSTGKSNWHLQFRIQLIESIVAIHGKGPKILPRGRPSVNPPPKRLLERHFIEKIPPTGRKAVPQKRCVVCYKNGKRKESVYWCPDCEAGLCLQECFKIYHTKVSF